MPRNTGTVKVKNFFGVNNVSQEEELKPGEFREAENVYITNAGKMRTRKGYSQLAAGDFHSLSGTKPPLVAKGQQLHLINADLTTTQIATLRYDMPLSYAESGGKVFFSNGYDIGTYYDGVYSDVWSVPPLNHQPDAAVVSGGLPPGWYQLAVTGVKDSVESPVGKSVVVNLTIQSGIQLSNFPDLSSYDKVRVYCSYPNGEQLLLIRELPTGTVSYLIGSNPEYGRELQTQFLQPMLPGKIVRYGHARLWVAEEHFVAYSKAMRPGLTDFSTDYFAFRSEVTVLQPVENGVWVVADRCYFLQGTDPAQTQLIDKGPMKAVSGTDVVVPAVDFMSQEMPGDVIIWTSDRGIVAGLPNGELLYLTEGRMDFTIGDAGTAMLARGEGADSYVSVLKKPNDEANNFAMTDRVTAEVRRNGVIIN